MWVAEVLREQWDWVVPVTADRSTGFWGVGILALVDSLGVCALRAVVSTGVWLTRWLDWCWPDPLAAMVVAAINGGKTFAHLDL